MNETYDQRANAHRPTDSAALQAEMRRLASSGLRVRDIAVALRIDLGAVLEALKAKAA